MNKVLLIGRLTKDAEILEVNEGGRKALKFTLAVDRSYKNASDGRDADFIPVVYFVNHADKLSPYLLKGRRISVTGKISVRSVQREDETRRYFTDIIADNIEFLESGKAAVNEF